ncbi:hypothetical protein ACFL1X_10640, partial [Candidatus Hydrogenedentota bacterium]
VSVSRIGLIGEMAVMWKKLLAGIATVVLLALLTYSLGDCARGPSVEEQVTTASKPKEGAGPHLSEDSGAKPTKPEGRDSGANRKERMGIEKGSRQTTFQFTTRQKKRPT